MDELAWDDNEIDKRRSYKHPVIQYECEQRMKLFKELIHSKPDYKVLELAAGDGHFSVHLNKLTFLKVSDSSRKMLSRNPFKEEAEIIGLPDIPIEEKSYDIIFIANILHHLEDEKSALVNASQVAKQYIYIIEPNRYNPFNFLIGILKRNERKSLRYSKSYLDHIFNDLGLVIYHYDRVGFFPPNSAPKSWMNFYYRFKYFVPRLFLFDHIYVLKV